MREKIYGSNNVCSHGGYARISIPPEVLDDDDIEIEVGDEVSFVGRFDENGERLVLETEGDN